jgi:hypothetical protein
LARRFREKYDRTSPVRQRHAFECSTLLHRSVRYRRGTGRERCAGTLIQIGLTALWLARWRSL